MTEKEFLDTYDRNKYNKPAVTVDIILLAKMAENLHVLLIKRGGHPYKGCWALPGGFVQENETVHQAVARELCEETDVSATSPTLLGIYSMPGRDPRGWAIGVAYFAEVAEKMKSVAGDDAAETDWFEILLEKKENRYVLTCKNERHTMQSILTKGDAGNDGYIVLQNGLAFDHAKMLIDAVQKISYI